MTVAEEVTTALESEGVACVYSTIANMDVVFVRSQAVTVPRKWAGLPRFTLAELRHLVKVGCLPEVLKAVVQAKQVLGGDIQRSSKEAI